MPCESCGQEINIETEGFNGCCGCCRECGHDDACESGHLEATCETYNNE